jgi:hypothetical protein
VLESVWRESDAAGVAIEIEGEIAAPLGGEGEEGMDGEVAF